MGIKPFNSNPELALFVKSRLAIDHISFAFLPIHLDGLKINLTFVAL